MTAVRTLLCTILTLAVGACASSPPVQYFSLDDGRPTALGSADGPMVAVTLANLPDLVDRAQLVVRAPGHELRLNDQYEWAEPLRRQIPRLIARGLGEALDSARVVASPMDGQDFNPHFKVTIDIQRLEVIAGQWVEIDAVWRAEPPTGNAFLSRSVVLEPMGTTTGPADYPAAVAAQSRALLQVGARVASGIRSWLGEMTASAVPRAEVERAGATDGGVGPDNCLEKQNGQAQAARRLQADRRFARAKEAKP